jgi:hypothetical protein
MECVPARRLLKDIENDPFFLQLGRVIARRRSNSWSNWSPFFESVLSIGQNEPLRFVSNQGTEVSRFESGFLFEKVDSSACTRLVPSEMTFC